jgi:hypothetical protein
LSKVVVSSFHDGVELQQHSPAPTNHIIFSFMTLDALKRNCRGGKALFVLLRILHLCGILHAQIIDT